MRIDVTYTVVRPFTYGGRQYQAGDDFVPEGGKWDKMLLDNTRFLQRSEKRVTAGRPVALPKEVLDGRA